MHALRSTQDLTVQVEHLPDHQIHRFYYKGIPLRKILWRPAQYRRVGLDVECNFCPGQPNRQEKCFICDANWYSDVLVPQGSPIGAKMDLYINQLFQIESPEFECGSQDGVFYARLFGETLLEIVQEWLVWTGSCAKNNQESLQVLDDRLEIRIRTNDPIIFYKADPFHRKILTELRKHEPFASAPQWF